MYLHQCHYSRREILILKLDFEKTFDTIEHNTILTMVQKLGFLNKWMDWTKQILNSTSSIVLLNGVTRKTFWCKRELRQGGPLSPLLFILTVELLQHVQKKASQLGLLQHPLDLSHTTNFLVI
jgi:hypothetical protein